MTVVISGCAAAPYVLRDEDIQNIKRLAVVTTLSEPELQIVDYTRITEPPYTQSGVLPLLIELAVREAQASAEIKASLGGDPDVLKETVSDFRIKERFDEAFGKMSSTGFEIIGPEEVERLGIKEYPEGGDVEGRTIKDYSALYNRLGVDTVVEIDFIYGLAAYRRERRPRAVIVADVSVMRLVDNELLMRKRIESAGRAAVLDRGYTVDEFNANGAELFKKKILEAMRYVAHIVARQLGIELSLK